MKTSPGAVVKSADRVLDVLELMVRAGRGMTHTEIAGALGIPKSSLTQLLGNLESRGYLAFTAGANLFAAGPALVALSRAARRQRDLAYLAQPIAERLTRLTNESSSLNLLRDGEVLRVCGASSTQPLHFSMTVGEAAPAYAVSSGKIILALMPEAEREAVIARMRFRRVTQRTIHSAAALRRELREAAANGHAVSDEEYTPGIVGLAVAVTDAAGAPLGAFNVAMPAVRDNPAHRRRVLAALRDAAVALRREIDAGDD